MNRTTCLLLIAVAAPCGRAGKDKTIEIALVTKALDSEWWQRVKSGAEEAARAVPGVHLVALAPKREVNIDQQVGILEDQIARGVSALAVAPAGVSEILPVLDKAKAAGIPVLIVDTDVNWPAKLSHIGADNRLGGRIAGEYIVKLLGGKGKVAVIRGILGIATHQERLAGFREATARAPGIECVAVQPANSDRALGMTVMENLLTAHPDLKAVFATNDQMALGAVEAIAAYNLTGKVDVVGFDATREAVRAAVAGRLSGDMAGLPEVMGRKAVEEAIQAAKGQPVEKQAIITSVLVTKENASQFMQ
jgi:ribose transport system substrate-binding protein